MKEIKRIGVLCPYSFPEGKAATNRIKAYSKGLIACGVEVDVIVFFTRDVNDGNPISGNHEGIQYEYINLTSSNNRIIKHTWDRVKIISRTYSYLKASNQSKPYDYLFLSFDHPVWLLVFGIMSHILGIRNSFICDEFPDAIRRMKQRVPVSQILLYKLASCFIDCRILMTEALQRFYDSKVCKKPTYILNSIVDTDKFNGITRQIPPRKYLCYMGSLILVKDNVDNIVKAFSLIADNYDELDLYIYGPPKSTDALILRQLIMELGLSERVFLKGWAIFSDVPQILSNASILVTSQPDTKRAEGGFPTKMAEYMMSRTPMIVTNVGEISKYVTDKKNAFIVEPSDPQKYAEAISFVMENPDIAAEVAERAFIDANQNYNVSSVVKPLVSFLQKLG